MGYVIKIRSIKKLQYASPNGKYFYARSNDSTSSIIYELTVN